MKKPANIGLLFTGLLVIALTAALGWSIRTPQRTVALATIKPAALSTGVASLASPTPQTIPSMPVTISPTPTALTSFCVNLIHTMQATFPQSGLQFSSVEKSGQLGRTVSMQGVTTGETWMEDHVDLTRMVYQVDGILRSLWFATGFVDQDGTYFPMNMLDNREERAWGTQGQAEAIFQQAGQGVFLTLTGFVRRDREIAWENCARWASFNPQGICGLGLELEFASHGGSMQFLQSSVAPKGWFAFGWAVNLDAGMPLPKDAGECVP